MTVVERDLQGWQVSGTPSVGSELSSFSLSSSPDAIFGGFTYTLSFPLPHVYRVLLTGPYRPRPPQDNIVLNTKPSTFKLVSLDASKYTAVFAFPEESSPLDGAKNKKREIRLNWRESIVLDVWERDGDSEAVRLLGDLPSRSYALTDHGIIRHWWIERDNIHIGLGEKAAPVDLTGRSFQMHGTDAAGYDAYEGDPLYKHTPFLVSSPKATVGNTVLPSTYAIYHPTNSVATWDIGRSHDDPWGYYKKFTQDWGGLEEWVIVGKGTREVVRTFAELVGKPKLVGRDWLGYLASGMGLGESDHPIAQELLSTWPDLCKKHDIPCSAMHLSSGYTVGDDGNRYVFTMNTKRYPDFKGMVKLFHKNGIKVAPNIKPYMLDTHPDYKSLHSDNGLFHNPFTGKPVQTRIWSSGVGDNGKGSWVDMTSRPGREWWARGVQSLVDLGCDGMWNDNNEFFLHDDAFVCQNDVPVNMASPAEGPAEIGLMGRMLNTEFMGKTSDDVLKKNNPDRRTFVLTRSGNVGTFKYASSTWTGDNATSWKNLRGSQAIQLNACLSLMQSTGSDIGGFGGPLPTPEMFARWVQLGVTHSRFCIHSFKPNKNDMSGAADTNTPWMYPEVLPIVRQAIKWRYQHLPFFNNLNWQSHLHAQPPNAPLFFGDFASDPVLYTEEIQNGFSAWLGPGQILTVPALHEGDLEQRVYFPKSSPSDASVYFDLHAPYNVHKAGTWATISTPLEHLGLFARQGSVIPIGKDYQTVTQEKGPSRTTPDGVDVQLESEGGVVGLDDWRAVQIFPGEEGSSVGEWIEDDGISEDPKKSIVEVSYTASKDSVEVSAKWKEHEFKTLWGKTLHVLLPVKDARTVKGAKESSWGDRTLWTIEVV